MDIIKLDDKEVRVHMSADTLRVYRQTYGRDLMLDMINMQETMDMEVIENLFYIAAKEVDPELPEIDEWLKQFSVFALYQGATQLMQIWTKQNKTLSQRKKKADQ